MPSVRLRLKVYEENRDGAPVIVLLREASPHRHAIHAVGWQLLKRVCHSRIREYSFERRVSTMESLIFGLVLH